MLAHVRQLHQELLSLIDEIDAEASRAAPDVPRLTHLRWRLGRAVGKRMRLMEQHVFPWLLGRLPTEQAEKVRALRDTNLAAAAAMSRHIGMWGLDTVTADWRGYRAASGAIRAELRDRIGAEVRLLYPLLGDAPAPAS